MQKEAIINYLNNIKPYLNLSAVCSLYNELHKDDQIDYNNLRVVLNRQSINRLSEAKLNNFLSFLQNDLFCSVFNLNYIINEEMKIIFTNNIKEYTNKMIESIERDLNDKF